MCVDVVLVCALCNRIDHTMHHTHTYTGTHIHTLVLYLPLPKWLLYVYQGGEPARGNNTPLLLFITPYPVGLSTGSRTGYTIYHMTAN